MMWKVGKVLIFAYLGFTLLPYFFIFLMYLFMKKMAKPGSEIEAKVHELENELISLGINLLHMVDPNFILMNISGLLLFVCIVYFLRKYKFMIPRNSVKNKKADTRPTL
ncbi:hypothetical protein ACFYKX_25390 [Cytobacillus sp. FJAT-54145]|uniref:Uncharacterized protein n=1 Tax=Cytobacillus spartinae TaxID=3299023 RepID=A0ABW6KL01_9BACI